jgi:hypothetical protein
VDFWRGNTVIADPGGFVPADSGGGFKGGVGGIGPGG